MKNCGSCRVLRLVQQPSAYAGGGLGGESGGGKKRHFLGR